MKNKTFFKISTIYFTAICLIAILFALGYTGVIQDDILSSFLIQIVVMFAIPMFMYTIFISKNVKQTFIDTGFKKISGKMILITIGLGFVLYALNQFVADIFGSFITLFGYEKITSSSTITLDYKFLLKELILSCILPGVCEEILHRGVMLHAGKKTTNPRYCLILSSILFGLVHLNINQFFYAAILGFLIGYVGLVSDSIFPCMIIHFMNNFLGSFIYYGAVLNWPICSMIFNLSNLVYSNPITLMLVLFIGTPVLLYFYKILIKRMAEERNKMKMKAIVKEVGMNSLNLEQAQEKINLINKILLKSATNQAIEHKNNSKTSFVDKMFIYSSIILGTMITVSSFIWGVI